MTTLARWMVPLFALTLGGCTPYYQKASIDDLLAAAQEDDGDGVDGDADQCPRAREDLDGFQDDDGCPDADNDGDGFVDAADACPTEAGGPASTDGCVPFLDADGDNVEDAVDDCPTEPETPNSYRDVDGCPDVPVKVGETALELGAPIGFEAGTADITAPGQLVVAEVAYVLKSTPALAVVEIGAHTDDVGSDRANKKLSLAQAEAVKARLIELGVAPERLKAQGYGEERPLMKGTSEEARAANRRVEITIVERAG
ncbi:MAG: OmpA family protein [Alphaproteobacteria bacterium]|nr:OmpA family protein [Alphaproteobacteria bacterium]